MALPSSQIDDDQTNGSIPKTGDAEVVVIGSQAKPQAIGQPYLHVPIVHQQAIFRPSIDTISNLSLYSADDDEDSSQERGRFLRAGTSTSRGQSRSPAPPRTWSGRWQGLWQRHKGVTLVIIAQLFSALMGTTARLLETDKSDGAPMNTFQVRFCFVRPLGCYCQSLTALAYSSHLHGRSSLFA